jgi:hypothetical protein
MNRQSLSPVVLAHEYQLEQPGDNRAKQELSAFAKRSPRAQQMERASYDLYAVRSHPTVGTEIFATKLQVHLGNYSERDLYGKGLGNPTIAFKSALSLLKDRADRLTLLDPDDPDTAEYGHQAALLWADVGALKSFIGTSPVVTEVVAELRTLRFQFLRKDTPPAIFQSLATALGGLIETAAWNTSAVDRLVETLEHAGYDSLVIDSLRVPNA